VTRLAGADAIAILRAGGFIAAIEPVPSELPEGTVIEQDPTAGIRLGREAVVALRLAVAPTTAPQVVEDGDPEPSGAQLEPADAEDTEHWFAALAVADGARRSPPARRRRRKQHAMPPCPHAFDPAPAPIVRVKEPSAAFTPPDRSMRSPGVRSGLASAPYVLATSLAGSPWRRGAALLPVLLLVAVLGTRFLAGEDRRQRSSHDRVLARTVRVQFGPRVSPRPIVHRAALAVGRVGATSGAARVVRMRRRVASRVNSISTPEPLPVATPVPSQHRPTAVAATAAHAAASSSSQFAYLGQ
jgi:hypothetical protein